MPVVARFRQLSLGYPERTLFRGLSMSIETGATLAVLGANGSGKSTLVKALLGLLQPLSGEIDWGQGRPREIGYLAQMSEFDRRFPIRARDLVAMGTWRRLGLRTALDKSAREKVAAALEEVGLASFANLPLHKLSAGQLQRALFARVIMQDAPFIVLDEPFIGIDQTTEELLLGILARWRREGRTVVMVIHDLSSVLEHCDQVLLLGGGLANYGTVDSVLTPDRLVAQGYLSESQAAWMIRSHAKDAALDDA